MTDANVWLDLEAGGLLEACFGFDVRWVVPDLVLAEGPMKPLRPRLETGGVRPHVLPPDDLDALEALGVRYPAPSVADLACLVVARAQGWVLLSGDAALRRAAEQEGVAFHGTLWLLRVAVGKGWLSPAQALHALAAMRTAPPPRRLPASECERLMTEWRTMR